MRSLSWHSDAWSDTVTRNPFQSAPVTSSSPRITLDIRRSDDVDATEDTRDLEALDDDDTRSSRTPFFFGAQRPANALEDRDALPPLSRDPYAHYDTTAPPQRGNNSNRSDGDDDDEYFFGAPPRNSEAPPKPTSWEEIRRRAASQQQLRK